MSYQLNRVSKHVRVSKHHSKWRLDLGLHVGRAHLGVEFWRGLYGYKTSPGMSARVWWA